MSTAEKLLKSLEFRVVRRLDGILQGDYRTLFFGQGLDLAEVREYQPGDEVRHIDWNVTARMARPYVRHYVEDRELSAWLILDRSASLEFGTANQLKRELVVEFAGTIAYLLARRGNRVGALICAAGIETTIPPSCGRNQVLLLLHHLSQTRRDNKPGATDLATILRQAGRGIHRRSLIFVVSDFIVSPGWEDPLRFLARHHEVIAVRVFDPRELTLPDVGYLWLEDPETGEQLLVDTGNARLRKRFNQAAVNQRVEIQGALARCGVDLLELSTAEDMVGPLLRFADRRKKKMTTWTSSGR